MKFDFHSELANQITIENLKCHRDWLVKDLNNLVLEEDRATFGKDLEALDRVLDYFCGNG